MTTPSHRIAAIVGTTLTGTSASEVVGWLGVVAGLNRRSAPELPQGGRDAATYAVNAVLFVVGAVLRLHALARRG